MMGRSPLQEVILLHTGWNEGPGHLEGNYILCCRSLGLMRYIRSDQIRRLNKNIGDVYLNTSTSCA